MKISADLHIHTRYSVDSRTSMAEYCERALALGLKTLCFTDHVDHNPGDPGTGYFRPEAQREEFFRTRDRYGDVLELLLGVEFAEPHLHPRELEALHRFDYDFILGSVHHWNGGRSPKAMVQAGVPPQEVYDSYWPEVLAAVQAGGFDSLAHLEFPRRYFPQVLYRPEQVVPVFELMVRKSLALEVNVSPFRAKGNEPLPGWELLELYRRSGGTMVTLGSDSHSPEHLGRGLKEGASGLPGGLVPRVYRGRKPGPPAAGTP